MPTNINVEIDELVLEGFEPGERHRIADALISELTRLFQSRQTHDTTFVSSSRDVVQAPALELTANAHSHQIGAQVAQAVFEGLQTSQQ